MKLNSAQIEQAVEQFEGEVAVVPEDNPIVPQLMRIFGDHTYFLGQNGLNIVEATESDQEDARLGVVMNIADWAGGRTSSLAPHAPETTGLVVVL